MRIERAVEMALPYGDIWAMDDAFALTALDYAKSHGRELAKSIHDYRKWVAEAPVRYRAAIENAGNDKEKLRKLNGYAVRDNIAVTEMTGTMDKRLTSMSYYLGGVSTMAMESTFWAIQNDPEVRGSLWVIESPGGNIMGVSELAQTVRSLQASKPILAYASDYMASAAQWAGAAATEVWANDTAVVGNAGVYTILVDSSKAMQDRGVTVYAVRSGKFKAVGETGVPIDEEQLAMMQNRVMNVSKVMARMIAKSRNLTAEQMTDIMTGRVYTGQEGVRAGLVDRIGSVDAAFKRLKQLTASAAN